MRAEEQIYIGLIASFYSGPTTVNNIDKTSSLTCEGC